jgi:hypothetical protein
MNASSPSGAARIRLHPITPSKRSPVGGRGIGGEYLGGLTMARRRLRACAICHLVDRAPRFLHLQPSYPTRPTPRRSAASPAESPPARHRSPLVLRLPLLQFFGGLALVAAEFRRPARPRQGRGSRADSSAFVAGADWSSRGSAWRRPSLNACPRQARVGSR